MSKNKNKKVTVLVTLVFSLLHIHCLPVQWILLVLIFFLNFAKLPFRFRFFPLAALIGATTVPLSNGGCSVSILSSSPVFAPPCSAGGVVFVFGKHSGQAISKKKKVVMQPKQNQPFFLGCLSSCFFTIQLLHHAITKELELCLQTKTKREEANLLQKTQKKLLVSLKQTVIIIQTVFCFFSPDHTSSISSTPVLELGKQKKKSLLFILRIRAV